MPVTCIVLGCRSRGVRDNVSFFRIPMVQNSVYYPQVFVLSKKRRQKWLKAINRDDLTQSILKNQRVCSKHFITGKPSAPKDEYHTDWVPSQHMGHTSQAVDGKKRVNKRNNSSIIKKQNDKKQNMPSKSLCFLCRATNAFTYYSFPKDPKVHASWLKVCSLTTKDDLTHIRICGMHFKTSDYFVYEGKRIILKGDAVPSLYINYYKDQKLNESLPDIIPYESEQDDSTDSNCNDSMDELDFGETTDTADESDVNIEFRTEGHHQENYISVKSDDKEIHEIEDEEIHEIEENKKVAANILQEMDQGMRRRVGYNNPMWLRNKINEQQIKMKLLEQKNHALRCKILDIKVSLGPKSTKKNARPHKSPKILRMNPSDDYPGFQEMLKQASLQNLDKDSLINNIFGSVREQSLKRYDSAFKEWLKFCSDYKVEIFEPEVSEVIDYFKSLLSVKTPYFSTLMIYINAILSILGEDKASDSELVSFIQELKDLFCSYKLSNCTWNPHSLLLHLSEQFPHEALNLDKLSRKVVILLALITKVRLQAIAQLKLEDITVNNEKIQLSFIDYITSNLCRSKRIIVNVPIFLETPQLCVYSALRHYMDLTSNLRSMDQDFLIIESKYPHNPVLLTTLNSWIRKSMTDAGVDLKIFSNSSVNLHELTDHQNEVLFEEIKRNMRWKDEMLIFTEFYNIN